MTMVGRDKDVECSSSCSRNCIDTIERHSAGMGAHSEKKKTLQPTRKDREFRVVWTEDRQ
jgi:hypothetical protein